MFGVSASCYICQTDIIIIISDNADVCILNGNLCHCAYRVGVQLQK